MTFRTKKSLPFVALIAVSMSMACKPPSGDASSSTKDQPALAQPLSPVDAARAAQIAAAAQATLNAELADPAIGLINVLDTNIYVAALNNIVAANPGFSAGVPLSLPPGYAMKILPAPGWQVFIARTAGQPSPFQPLFQQLYNMSLGAGSIRSL